MLTLSSVYTMGLGRVFRGLGERAEAKPRVDSSFLPTASDGVRLAIVIRCYFSCELSVLRPKRDNQIPLEVGTAVGTSTSPVDIDHRVHATITWAFMHLRIPSSTTRLQSMVTVVLGRRHGIPCYLLGNCGELTEFD